MKIRVTVQQAVSKEIEIPLPHFTRESKEEVHAFVESKKGGVVHKRASGGEGFISVVISDLFEHNWPKAQLPTITEEEFNKDFKRIKKLLK